ncbi:MAG: sensor histidine kinase [Caulobacteraceae bacterium]
MSESATNEALSYDDGNRPRAVTISISDEARSSFLRVASHQLRTPLNSIIGFSEILAGETLGPLGAPQYRNYAEHVCLAGHKLLKLVNQILEILRLQAGIGAMAPVEESLDAAIDDCLDALAAEIRKKDLRVFVEGEGKLPTLTCDPRGLRAILSNLLANAVAFSPEGGEIAVSARSEGGRTVVAIRDEGPGIDVAEVPRLLQPFQQGANALTGCGEGAGFGLPIVSLHCALMRATLRLKPGLERGLMAEVSLPTSGPTQEVHPRLSEAI